MARRCDFLSNAAAAALRHIDREAALKAGMSSNRERSRSLSGAETGMSVAGEMALSEEICSGVIFKASALFSISRMPVVPRARDRIACRIGRRRGQRRTILPSAEISLLSRSYAGNENGLTRIPGVLASLQKDSPRNHSESSRSASRCQRSRFVRIAL